MPSEVRVNQLQSAAGLSTTVLGVGVTFTTTDVTISGGTMTLSDGLPFYSNSQTVTSNHTVGGSENSMSAGPITINSSITVTISSGGAWTIV